MNFKKGAILFFFLFLMACGSKRGEIIRITDYDNSSIIKNGKKIDEVGNVYHFVQNGQTLYRISKIYGLSVEELKEMNGLKNNYISVGQKLLIKATDDGSYNVVDDQGGYYTVKNGDTLYSISRRYGLPLDKLKQINNLNNNDISIGQRLLINNDSVSKRFHTELRKYRWPVEWKGVTSPYGYRYHPVLKMKRLHDGVDLRASMNTPVYSSYSGTVSYAGWMRGYGKIVIIDHPRGYSTRYAHLNKIFVEKGDNVNIGKLIGKSGNTGVSTGPHLHYEIRYNEKSLDPIEYRN